MEKGTQASKSEEYREWKENIGSISANNQQIITNIHVSLKKKMNKSQIGKKSKRKGSSFERDIVLAFSTWAENKPKFRRNTGLRNQYTSFFRGDIVPDWTSLEDIKKYPSLFAIECKNTESWGELSKLLTGQGEIVKQYWKQTLKESEDTDFIPLLVLKKRNHQPLCFFPVSLIKYSIFPISVLKGSIKYLKSKKDIDMFMWGNIVIIALDNFFKIFNYSKLVFEIRGGK